MIPVNKIDIKWLKEGHDWLGKRTVRVFEGRRVKGSIVLWVAPSEDGRDQALWKNRHEDGDEEELVVAEAIRAMALHRQLEEHVRVKRKREEVVEQERQSKATKMGCGYEGEVFTNEPTATPHHAPTATPHHAPTATPHHAPTATPHHAPTPDHRQGAQGAFAAPVAMDGVSIERSTDDTSTPVPQAQALGSAALAVKAEEAEAKSKEEEERMEAEAKARQVEQERQEEQERQAEQELVQQHQAALAAHKIIREQQKRLEEKRWVGALVWLGRQMRSCAYILSHNTHTHSRTTRTHTLAHNARITRARFPPPPTPLLPTHMDGSFRFVYLMLYTPPLHHTHTTHTPSCLVTSGSS
jgi:hypothetical protein